MLFHFVTLSLFYFYFFLLPEFDAAADRAIQKEALKEKFKKKKERDRQAVLKEKAEEKIRKKNHRGRTRLQRVTGMQ